MKTQLQLYLRTGVLFGSDYVELCREIDLPFAPTVGLKLQFTPSDISENMDYVERMMGYLSLATGILTVEEVYYHVDEQYFICMSWETVTNRDEMLALADQWVHTYAMRVESTHLAMVDDSKTGPVGGGYPWADVFNQGDAESDHRDSKEDPGDGRDGERSKVTGSREVRERQPPR